MATARAGKSLILGLFGKPAADLIVAVNRFELLLFSPYVALTKFLFKFYQ